MGNLFFIILSYSYDDDSRLVLRFLQGLDWDIPKTHLAINDHYKWKIETFPIDPSPFQHFLNQGIIYFYKRDKSMRPIFVFNVDKMAKSGVISIIFT